MCVCVCVCVNVIQFLNHFYQQEMVEKKQICFLTSVGDPMTGLCQSCWYIPPSSERFCHCNSEEGRGGSWLVTMGRTWAASIRPPPDVLVSANQRPRLVTTDQWEASSRPHIPAWAHGQPQLCLSPCLISSEVTTPPEGGHCDWSPAPDAGLWLVHHVMSAPAPGD